MFEGVDSPSCPPSASVIVKDFLRLVDSSKGFVAAASTGTGTSGEELLLLFEGVDLPSCPPSASSCPPSASVIGKDILRLVDSSKWFVAAA